LSVAYSSGASWRQAAAQFGKSSQAFYKTIQRLRAALLDCVSRELRVDHGG
jgi:RNA polymerase sigma-70 factor (ECF subfamily)